MTINKQLRINKKTRLLNHKLESDMGQLPKMRTIIPYPGGKSEEIIYVEQEQALLLAKEYGENLLKIHQEIIHK